MLLYHSLAAGISLVIGTSAQTWPTDLVGTWSTKSNQTLTGPVRHFTEQPGKRCGLTVS